MYGIFAIAAALGIGVFLFRRSQTAESTDSLEYINVDTPYLPIPKLLDTRPRGIRNNNPTNIKDFGIPWRGKIGTDGPFVVFATPIDGLRAGFLNLYSAIYTHKADTIRTLAARWAPPTENNTVAYQDSLRRQTGLGLDTKINYARDSTNILNAIVRHENGQNPYTPAQYDQAYREAGK